MQETELAEDFEVQPPGEVVADALQRATFSYGVVVRNSMETRRLVLRNIFDNVPNHA
jgi:hypothetical protein